MANKSLTDWLNETDPELTHAIISEVRSHTKSLQHNGKELYGYSILCSDYATAAYGPSIAVAYSCKDDIDTESEHNEEDKLLHKYCVDEWANFFTEGFHASNAMLEMQYVLFNKMHTRNSDDDFMIDESEWAFVDKIHRAIFDAFRSLKAEGAFEDDTFLVIWISGSMHEIVFESVTELNPEQICQEFEAIFRS